MSNVTFVVGDVHGQLAKLTGHLQRVGLIGDELQWMGGSAQLWFMGDYTDRGPDGIGVIDLIMRLQREAVAVGGEVGGLLGNHEVLLLAAYRFGEQVTPFGESFMSSWVRNGGQQLDMERLTPRHIAWMTKLPAMAHVADRLLMHADANFYINYGLHVSDVNLALRGVLASDDILAVDHLLDETSERGAFGGPDNAERDDAEQMLQIFGGRQIIHGHTPISSMRRIPASAVTEPYLYADGLCVNVDGGMYLGGPGFVYQLPPFAAQ